MGSDIFVMPSAGGEPRQITHDVQDVHGISFTGDGKQLIFSSARIGGARRALWRVPVAGGSPVRLPFGTDNADSPAVARSGDHLAYVQISSSAKIWAYDIPQKGEIPRAPKLLIGSSQVQVGPQYSPDGKRLAFASSRTGPYEIWISAADGTNAMQLTNFGDRQTGTPRWSYDGKYIVFDAHPDQQSDIYIVDSQGGTPRRVTSGSYDHVVPSFSRDGQWIYFSSNEGGRWDLWKVAASGATNPFDCLCGFDPCRVADCFTANATSFPHETTALGL
jgi:tricorn protease-like protein